MTPSDVRRVGEVGWFTAALLALTTLGLPASLRAQTQPAAIESMEVVLVNVEVWAHDREGVPIGGLTADHFEVLEDGQPVPITHFAEVREPSRLEVGGAAAGAEEPPAAQGEPSHLVVYFDLLHLTRVSLQRVTTALQRFLDEGRVPPERVLVLRQGHDLATEVPLGSSREELRAGLQRVAEGKTLGEVDPRGGLGRLQTHWEVALTETRRPPCSVFVPAARMEIARQSDEIERRSAVTIASLRATARLLSAVRGPKTMLFVSDSLATRPGAELVRFAQQLCPDARELADINYVGSNVQLGQWVLEFAQEASGNRITVYPFQASGLRPSRTMGAEQRGFSSTAMRGVEMLERAGEREGLFELARQTGGWAVNNRTDFAADLQRLADDMTGYYSLAYVPRQPGAGGNHQIEVRWKGQRPPGAQIRHRLGYRSAPQSMQERLEGAVAFGAMHNPLAVRMAVGTLGEAAAGRYGLPLHVLVPAAGVTFLPQPTVDRATLLVAIRATNARSHEVVQHEERFHPSRPGEGAELLDLRTTLQLPAGVYVLAVAVRDELTGESSVVATSVAIQDPALAATSAAATPGR
jgi:VWFA-related protein